MRRALDQLTAKRLIAHIPNRGYHVYAMDPDVHGQIRDIRILLETGAAADLMPNVTSARARAGRALRCCRLGRALRHENLVAREHQELVTRARIEMRARTFRHGRRARARRQEKIIAAHVGQDIS